MKHRAWLYAVIFLGLAGSSLAADSDPKIKELEKQISQLKQITEQLQSEVKSLKTQKVISSESTEKPVFVISEYEEERDAGKFYRTPMSRLNDFNTQIGTLEKADMSLYMGLETAGRYQIISQDDVFITPAATTDNPTPAPVEQTADEPGFQTPWASMSFLADFNNRVDVYFDLYISSRGHSDTVYGHEGYILLRNVPENLEGNSFFDTIFDYISIKAGAFDIEFGDQQYRRSNNAHVQQNPLIGNYVVDPSSEEIGVEVFSKPQMLNWLVGATSGTTTEDFKDGRGLAAVHGKLWADLPKSLQASTSAYYVDHSDNPSKPSGTGSSFFSGNRSGGSYSSIFDNGHAPGQVFPGNGQEVIALQGDLTWNWKSFELYGHYGWIEDSDTNGSTRGTLEENWRYYAAEAVYHFTPHFYLAGRYSGASADHLNNLSSDGYVNRFQVGGGFWMTDHLLAKVEYVYEDYNDFTQAGGKESGVDVWRDPSFNGVISEVSFSF